MVELVNPPVLRQNRIRREEVAILVAGAFGTKSGLVIVCSKMPVGVMK
jgi:hypothetical protein